MEFIKVSIKYHNMFYEITGKRAEVIAFPSALFVKDLVMELCQRYGEKMKHALAADSIRIFVNGKPFEVSEFHEPIPAEAKVDLLALVSGG